MERESFDEMMEILNKLEEDLKAEEINKLAKSGYGKYVEMNPEISEEEANEMIDELIEKEGKKLEDLVGKEIITESGKEGVIVKDFGDGSYLVRLVTDGRMLVFSAKDFRLKEAQFKPGDIVKRKGEAGGEEYVVTEIDEAGGKAKVKSKTTGEESVVDVEHIEKTSQRRPYEAPKIEIKEEEVEEKEEIEEEKEEKEEEKIEEKPEVKEEVPEIKEEEKPKVDVVQLSETIKAIFTDPEIAVMIVEKLLDIVTERGLEKELVERLAKAGLNVSDLVCPVCLKKEGLKIIAVFEDVLKKKR